MSNGLGQSDFQWGLRTNPKIREIWEKLYQTKELVVSFDGFSLFLSKEQNAETWLHIDQHPTDPLYSVQGAYNFFPVGEEDAGFIVVPGSHITYNALNVEKHRKFILIEEDDPHREKAVKLIIPENCFVLWNSKTIHANTGMGMMKSKEINRLTLSDTPIIIHISPLENVFNVIAACANDGKLFDRKRAVFVFICLDKPFAVSYTHLTLPTILRV